MIDMKKWVFDLDNTLIFTDLLNNYSYNHALNKFGFEQINHCKRITRNILFHKYSNLNTVQKNELIQLKQDCFITNMDITVPNILLLGFLNIQKKEDCILWTSADKERALSLLEYYHISKKFKEIIFSRKVDVIQDVDTILSLLGCRSENLVFFEDNLKRIKELQDLKLNVIKVLTQKERNITNKDILVGNINYPNKKVFKETLAKLSKL